VNLAFESADTDLAKLYTDLRSLVYTLARRILKPQAVAETTRPGILRKQEMAVLKQVLNNSENLLPVDRTDLGGKFLRLQQQLNMDTETCNRIRKKCGEYIYELLKQLIHRVPGNVDHIEKIRNFFPHLVLCPTAARPTFQQLPYDFAGIFFF